MDDLDKQKLDKVILDCSELSVKSYSKFKNIETIIASYNTRINVINQSLIDLNNLLENLNSNILKKEIHNLKSSINKLSVAINYLKESRIIDKEKINDIEKLKFKINNLEKEFNKAESCILNIKNTCNDRKFAIKDLDNDFSNLSNDIKDIKIFKSLFDGLDISDVRKFVKQINAWKLALPLLITLVTLLNLLIAFGHKLSNFF